MYSCIDLLYIFIIDIAFAHISTRECDYSIGKLISSSKVFVEFKIFLAIWGSKKIYHLVNWKKKYHSGQIPPKIKFFMKWIEDPSCCLCSHIETSDHLFHFHYCCPFISLLYMIWLKLLPNILVLLGYSDFRIIISGTIIYLGSLEVASQPKAHYKDRPFTRPQGPRPIIHIIHTLHMLAT
ncbi:hypothetical protein ACJX0J_024401, partial [Zea mays]